MISRNHQKEAKGEAGSIFLLTAAEGPKPEEATLEFQSPGL